MTGTLKKYKAEFSVLLQKKNEYSAFSFVYPHRIISFLLLIAIVSVFVNVNLYGGEVYPDVRIVERDAGGITLEYRTRGVSYDTLTIETREYIDVTFYGGESVIPGDPSAPELRYRSVAIALPSADEAKIEVIQRDYQTVRGLRIPPAGELRRDEEGMVYRGLPEGYSGIRPLSESPLAEIDGIGEVRGVVLGTVRIYPVHVTEEGTSVEIHDRMLIRVTYGAGGEIGPVDEATYNVLRRVVLNSGDIRVTSREGVSARESYRDLQGILTGAGVREAGRLSTGNWYRIEVEEEGMYRIPSTVLESAGIAVSLIDPGTIRMYSHGGKMLPEDIRADRYDGLKEIAIHVQERSGGVVDYIVFYGRGTTYWEYNVSEGLYEHRQNDYTEKNVYFLTYGGESGKRMESVPSLNEQGAVRPQYFISSLLHRNRLRNLIGSGREWVGEQFRPGQVMVFTNVLNGYIADSGEPINYRVQVAARASAQSGFTMADQGTSLGTVTVPGVVLDNDTFFYARRSAAQRLTRSGTLPEGNRSALRFEYQGGDRAEGYLEWFEIHYPRRFRAENNYLKFTSPDMTGVMEYNVQNFNSTQIHAYDISDHSSVKRITGAETQAGGAIRFQSAVTEGNPRIYTAVNSAGYRSIGSLEVMENSDLRSIMGGYDFIIISHPEFMQSAERLRDHRENFPGNQLSTLAVNVKHIYNEFSGGLPDPTAIRDFLHHAYLTWSPSPMFVMLLGAGSYDYLGVMEGRRNYIPSYQTSESFYQINSYTSDDYFVYFNPPLLSGAMRISMSIGRLNAISAEDAQTMVDKIIHYETNSDFGVWRNRITYIADNGLTTGTRDEGRIYTQYSEELALLYTPQTFETDKIYQIEYPIEITSQGRRQPEVNNAIINSFNQGTLIMNWIGHGNPRVWAHENIFVRETTIPQLNNRDRLPYIVAATCDFSRFDDPDDQSGAELLMSREQGGAIGILSPSRVVYGQENRRFNNLYFQELLIKAEGVDAVRVGDALFATKQVYNNVNDNKFILLGDPTLRLLVPRYNAEISAINNIKPADTLEMKALQRVTIEGEIRNRDMTLMEDFDGSMSVTVYDSDKRVTIPRWNNFEFIVPGNLIFRGESSVSRGEFTTEFVVPKDISHEETPGRVALYFRENSFNGGGYTRNTRFGGIDTEAAEDNEGPSIDMYLEDRNFRSGDMVSGRPLLIVDLYDESGINISGAGVGHRIEAWLNERVLIDLTDYYTGVMDSYREGTIEYRMDELETGPHHLRLRAWDVYNNSSTEEIFFSVADLDGLAIRNVYNYPNPFRYETVFTFQHNTSVPIDVDIKIYTVAGRMIAHLREFSVTDRFVRIPWTGRDADGDRPANGVYLYKVVAKTVDGEFTSEALGRLAVMR